MNIGDTVIDIQNNSKVWIKGIVINHVYVCLSNNKHGYFSGKSDFVHAKIVLLEFIK